MQHGHRPARSCQGRCRKATTRNAGKPPCLCARTQTPFQRPPCQPCRAEMPRLGCNTHNAANTKQEQDQGASAASDKHNHTRIPNVTSGCKRPPESPTCAKGTRKAVSPLSHTKAKAPKLQRLSTCRTPGAPAVQAVWPHGAGTNTRRAQAPVFACGNMYTAAVRNPVHKTGQGKTPQHTADHYQFTPYIGRDAASTRVNSAVDSCELAAKHQLSCPPGQSGPASKAGATCQTSCNAGHSGSGARAFSAAARLRAFRRHVLPSSNSACCTVLHTPHGLTLDSARV